MSAAPCSLGCRVPDRPLGQTLVVEAPAQWQRHKLQRGAARRAGDPSVLANLSRTSPPSPRLPVPPLLPLLPCPTARLEQEKRKLRERDKPGKGAASKASRANLAVRVGAATGAAAGEVSAWWSALRGSSQQHRQRCTAGPAGSPAYPGLCLPPAHLPLCCRPSSPFPQNIRVVQPNLVYAVGLSLEICTEEALRDQRYFGQFGRAVKISVNRGGHSSGGAQGGRHGASGSAYVTFKRHEGEQGGGGRWGSWRGAAGCGTEGVELGAGK